MNFRKEIKVGTRYRIRGYRHFQLDAYRCDNPLHMLGRKDKIGVMQTGDSCKVIHISEYYTQIEVKREKVWVNTIGFQCSIK